MKTLLFTLSLVISISLHSFSQNGWTQVASYPGSGSCAVSGFNFQSTGLAGLGYYSVNTNNFADIWEYFPATDTWVSKANFPGASRYNQSGFSLGKLAYICLGNTTVVFLKDMWQFDGNANTWTQKADFPGTERYGAAAIGVGTKAYVGLGKYNNNGTIIDYFADFYMYNQSTNTWTQKTTFPGQARYNPLAFQLNSYIYVVGGYSVDPPWTQWTFLRDMYAYDIANDTWTQKTSYPGSGAVMFGGFALGQYAYAGMGWDGNSNYSDFWKYDPVTDSWSQLPDFPGGSRRGPYCFNINTTGYVGCGMGTSDIQDMWKYIDPSLGIEHASAANELRIYPEPAHDNIYIEGSGIRYIELYSANGQLLKHTDVDMLQTKTSIDISGLAMGFYYVKIFNGKSVIARKVVKN